MRLCIIEKDRVVREMLQNFLVDLGHVVVTLSDMAEIGEQRKNSFQGFDVILVENFTMGPSIAAQLDTLHKRYAEASIVLMGTRHAVFSTNQVLFYGIFGFLNKPVRLTELELMLIRIFENKEQHAL
ncbi:response regulator [Deltaproteobacteria bacterium TL4]